MLWRFDVNSFAMFELNYKGIPQKSKIPVRVDWSAHQMPYERKKYEPISCGTSSEKQTQTI